MPSILETQRIIIEKLNMLTLGSCCPDNTSLFDDSVSTDITPNVGDAPTHWGEQEVTDWEDWERHLCGAAYRYADYLIDSANQMQSMVSAAAFTVAAVAAILALLSGAGLLLVISYGTAAAGVNAVAQLAGTAVFGDSAIVMQANRDQIVCGVKNDNLAAVMESILGPIAWVFYQHVLWQNATNIIWEGGIPGGLSLDEVVPSDCPDCALIPPALPVSFTAFDNCSVSFGVAPGITAVPVNSCLGVDIAGTRTSTNAGYSSWTPYIPGGGLERIAYLFYISEALIPGSTPTGNYTLRLGSNNWGVQLQGGNWYAMLSPSSFLNSTRAELDNLGIDYWTLNPGNSIIEQRANNMTASGLTLQLRFEQIYELLV